MAHVYLLNPGGNSIDIYAETGKMISSIVLGATSQPTSLAVDSARGRMFVDVLNTSSNTWSLQVIEDLSSVRKCGFPEAATTRKKGELRFSVFQDIPSSVGD